MLSINFIGPFLAIDAHAFAGRRPSLDMWQKTSFERTDCGMAKISRPRFPSSYFTARKAVRQRYFESDRRPLFFSSRRCTAMGKITERTFSHLFRMCVVGRHSSTSRSHVLTHGRRGFQAGVAFVPREGGRESAASHDEEL